MVFYQDNYDFLKGDLVKMFPEFFERGILKNSMAETFVCLIPKKENANRA